MSVSSCVIDSECVGLVTSNASNVLTIDYLRILVLLFLLIGSIIISKRFKKGYRKYYLITSFVILGFLIPTCTCDLVIVQSITSFIFSLEHLWVTLPLVTLAFIIIIFTIIKGRYYCGWVCPLGAIQELVNKPTNKELINNVWKNRLQKIKYLVLVLVIVFTFYGVELKGPTINLNKFSDSLIIFLTISLVMVSLFTYRPWCNYFCPFGALLSLINRLSFNKLKLVGKCNHCSICNISCKNAAINNGIVNHFECIRCNKCVNNCPSKSLK